MKASDIVTLLHWQSAGPGRGWRLRKVAAPDGFYYVASCFSPRGAVTLAKRDQDMALHGAALAVLENPELA
jgi:hypothetical protein